MRPRYTITPTAYLASAFGSGIKERTASFTKKYRFGFNNQEQETELGEYYSFEYRVHDARLGRFLSVDPLAPEYPWNSTYAFAENIVIWCKDLEGLERAIATQPAVGVNPNAGPWMRTNYFVGTSPDKKKRRCLLYFHTYYNVIVNSLDAMGGYNGFYNLQTPEENFPRNFVANTGVPGGRIPANTWTPRRTDISQIAGWNLNTYIFEYATRTAGFTDPVNLAPVNVASAFNFRGQLAADNTTLINGLGAAIGGAAQAFNTDWSQWNIAGGAPALAAAINFGAPATVSDNNINPTPGADGDCTLLPFAINPVMQTRTKNTLTGITLTFDANATQAAMNNVQAQLQARFPGITVNRPIRQPGLLAGMAGPGGASVADSTAPGGVRPLNANLDFQVTLIFRQETQTRTSRRVTGAVISSNN